MTGQFNGERLKEARYYNSLSITQLSEELSVSKQMVSKYENNKSAPNLEAVFTMVRVLGFPKEFFFGKNKKKLENEGTFYRSLMTSTKKQKSPSRMLINATSIYRDFLEDYVVFPNTQNYNWEDYTPKEAAHKLRALWKLNDEPITNMMNILEKHGFTIVFLPKNMEKVDAFGSYVFIDDNKYYIIAIKQDTSFFRQQFNLAHELGHRILHAGIWDPEELNSNEYKLMENQANEFAADFLLPQKPFIERMQNINNLHDIFKYKEYWYTAGAAILYRMKQLNLIDDNEYLKYQKQISYRGIRKNEPFDNEYPVKEPSLINQATELIVNKNIIKSSEIPMYIESKYGIKYPNELLEKIALLPHGYFNFTEGKKIFNLKIK